jgi:threonine/homoserine/homoserine lactone efflux protein
MILVGLLLFEWLKLPTGRGRIKGFAERVGRAGTPGATMILGLLFAMSFCPTTAALFFGSLIPLAVLNESQILLPAAYALGVSVPVIAIVLLVLGAAQLLARTVARINLFEWWMRRATATLFLIVGIYFTLAYTFKINL